MLRILGCLFLIVPVLVGAAGPGNATTTHERKTVLVFHSPDTRPCSFFRLEGVAEADPVVPGRWWFAIPQDHIGYDEIVAMMIAAHTTGRPVDVVTDGTVVCGHARVGLVRLH